MIHKTLKTHPNIYVLNEILVNSILTWTARHVQNVLVYSPSNVYKLPLHRFPLSIKASSVSPLEFMSFVISRDGDALASSMSA